MSKANETPTREELLLAAQVLEAAGVDFCIGDTPDAFMSLGAEDAVEYAFDKDATIARLYDVTVEQLIAFREFEANGHSLQCCGTRTNGRRCGNHMSAYGLKPKDFAREIRVFCHLHRDQDL